MPNLFCFWKEGEKKKQGKNKKSFQRDKASEGRKKRLNEPKKKEE